MQKKSTKKKNKKKNMKKTVLVLNTSLPSSSNPRLTPTEVVAFSSLLVPFIKKEVNESKTERRELNENKSGYIFMCNRKTKPECYLYRIFGLPRGKLGAVKNIKPGMKLFLYDFEQKFLYGVYEATSRGALDLEHSAFNGLFPAQVKFKILKDVLPLPESIFRHAIKDNYQGGNKFKQELNQIQVKSLISLFHDIALASSSPTVHFLPHPSAPPIVEEGARFPPSENSYFSRRHYVQMGSPLDTRTKQSVQLREYGSNEFRSSVAPLIMEERARFPPLVNLHFSWHQYLPTRPPHDTETEQVVQYRECGLYEYQTHVTGLQPYVNSKHVVQSEAVYKPYYLAEAHQPYVPENPSLLSPYSYKRNLTLMNPREQDFGRHHTGSDCYYENLTGERTPDCYGQHLHSTMSSVSVPAHGGHPQPDLQHLPLHYSYYTAQSRDLLRGNIAQRTVQVSYSEIGGNILVSSRYTSAGVAPSYQ